MRIGLIVVRNDPLPALFFHDTETAPLTNPVSKGDAFLMPKISLKLRASEFQRLGRYIVADPRVCGGKPTFEGSRVMVWQVLDQVAEGMPWEQISWSWRGKVTLEAIAEAVRLAASEFRSPRHVPHRRERLRTRSLALA